MKLKEAQLLYLVIKLTKTLALAKALWLYQRLVRDENLRKASVSNFFRADNYTDVIENF